MYPNLKHSALYFVQFNAGSAATANAYAGQVFLTTNAAASSAMFAWVMLDLFKGRKMSCVGACVGAIIGLVAITPCAGKSIHEHAVTRLLPKSGTA